MRRREPDPETVNVSELLANWLAPEVSFSVVYMFVRVCFITLFGKQYAQPNVGLFFILLFEW